MSCAHSTRSSGWNSTGNKLLTGAINKTKEKCRADWGCLASERSTGLQQTRPTPLRKTFGLNRITCHQKTQ